jgi:single-strand DNA-binding protein
MKGVNKVILIGNATRDAELRHTSSGKPVSNLRIATNRLVRGQEATQFHTVVCWDTLAETTGRYVRKGRPGVCRGAARVPHLHRRGRQGARQRGDCRE